MLFDCSYENFRDCFFRSFLLLNFMVFALFAYFFLRDSDLNKDFINISPTEFPL
jgi:hypothetical protein